MLGLLRALPVVRPRGLSFDCFACSASCVFLCLPTAVVARLFRYFRGPVALAICVVVFPRVFRYARNILVQTYALPHVLTASAKGLSTLRILLWHIFPVAAPQILALDRKSTRLNSSHGYISYAAF